MIIQSTLNYNYYLNRPQKQNIHFKSNENRNFDFYVKEDDDFYAGDHSTFDDWIADIYKRRNIRIETSNSSDSLKDAHLANFQVHPNNSYSGERLTHKSDDIYKKLKTAGANTVIDLVGYEARDNLDKKCKNENLDYIFFDMTKASNDTPIFYTDEEYLKIKKSSLSKLNFTEEEQKEILDKYYSNIDDERTANVKEFANLIKTVNKGGFYMCCELGDYRTKNCLAVVSLFNPKWPKDKKVDPTYNFSKNIVTMYRNLTDEHKEILNIDEDYDEWLKNYTDNLAEAIEME